MDATVWKPDVAARFVSTLFAPGDYVLVRPLETWTDAAGKKTRVDFAGITYMLMGLRNATGQWQPDATRLEASLARIFARASTEKTNVTFGVCPRLGGSGRFDKAWQIRTVRSLWLDLDDCTPDEAIKRAEQNKFPTPSVVIGSGHGTHLYWVLSQAELIDDAAAPLPVHSEKQPEGEKRRSRQYVLGPDGEKLYQDVRANVPALSAKAQRIQDILSGMSSMVGGDNTQDLSRTLRLPGTLNQKGARNCEPSVPCVLLELNEHRYPMSEFERFLENSPARIKRAKIAQVPLPEPRRVGVKTWDRFSELLAMCATAEVGERSEADFALCCYGVERGLAEADVWTRASKVGKFAAKDGAKYFERTWQSAQQRTRERVYERAVSHAKPRDKSDVSAKPGANGQPALDGLDEDRRICEALGLDVLGELPDNGGVKVFSRHYGKTVVLKRVAFTQVVDLLQIVGPVARNTIHSGKDEIPGMYRLQRVQEAIALLGGAESAGEEAELGQGVWRAKDDLLIMVNPKVSASWDGTKLTPVCSPRVGGLTVNMDLPTNLKWYDHDRLAEYLEKAANNQWCEAVLAETAAVFRKWNWHEVTMDAAAELVAGLILCTFVESCWTWRPLVAITAESDAGKSLFFETLALIFGPIALLNAKSTEAGIRQAVGLHAKAILCDEFESDIHREKILEFFRTASRGSQTLRGTSNQQAQRYGLKHIPWCAAVGIKLDRAPDRNRFIFLEFRPVPREQRGKIDLPTEAALADLGQRLLAIAVRHVVAADKLAVRLRNTQIPDVHGRVVESYSTPAAMLATAIGLNDAEATNVIRNLVAKTEQDAGHATKDQTELLGDILSSEVSLDRGARATVAQIMRHPHTYDGGWEALERMGIRPISKPGLDAYSNSSSRDFLFIAVGPIRRYLLKGTRWTEEPVDQILLRLTGATRSQHQVGGHRPRGVQVPWDLIERKYMCDDDEVEAF
jgi:hypothetical protein